MVRSKLKELSLFVSYAYSKFLNTLLRPLFEIIWLIGGCLQLGLLKARQSWVVDNFSTQSWLDFLEYKLNRSTSNIKFEGKRLKFSNRGSQEFWRFMTLPLKEPDTVAWISRMSSAYPNATLIDVGANIGIYSLLWMVKGSGRVLCVEPLPSNVLALQRNLELNKFTSRAQIFQVAASDRMATVCLRTPSMVRGEGFASIEPSLANRGGFLKLHVSAVRLDSLDTQAEHLVVKIDVEGAELEVVQGMTGLLKTGQVKSVIFEKNPRESGVKEILHGFGFVEIDGIPGSGNVVMDLSGV